MSRCFQPQGLQHARLPCPLLSPRVCSDSSIESVMLSKYLILCHPLLLLPSIFPSFRVFSSKSALHIRWPKYWSFSFSISPSNEYSGLISVRNDCVAYCSCIVTSEIRKCESSNFLLLFQIVLTVWIPCNSI